MASKKITVTIPEELFSRLKEITDNVSGFTAEALCWSIRQELMRREVEMFYQKQGPFSQEEIDAAERDLAFDKPQAMAA